LYWLYFESFVIFTGNGVLEFEKDILSCLKILRRGGTILYPTDTIWGVGCDATNPDAVKKIFDLKQRPSSKSMIVLVADRGDINRYTSQPDPTIAAYLETIERPTTVIYEGAIGFAENLVSEDGTIAIRIVQDDFCRHLIKRYRKPVVSTSANISGDEPPENFSLISEEIKNAVDYVVQYRQQDITPAKASALIRFSKSGELVILRN
jgi:L-threonylcarbamoyladenylate synthase